MLTLPRYLDAKRDYNQKRRAGTLTVEEEIIWLSLEMAEKSRAKIKSVTSQAQVEAVQEEAAEDVVNGNDLFWDDEPVAPALLESNKRSRSSGVEDGDDVEYVPS